MDNELTPAMQAVVDELEAKIRSGKKLTQEERDSVLELALTFVDLSIAIECVNQKFADKRKMSTHNILQNSLDRRRSVRPKEERDPLGDMRNLWQTAIDRSGSPVNEA